MFILQVSGLGGPSSGGFQMSDQDIADYEQESAENAAKARRLQRDGVALQLDKQGGGILGQGV